MKSFITFDIKNLSIHIDVIASEYLKSKYGMTYSEFLVLMSLVNCKTQTQREIASWTLLSEMVVSKIVRKLQTENKLVINKDPNDRKVNLVTISQKTSSEALRALEEIDAIFLKYLGGLTQKIISQTHNLIIKMKNAVREII